MSIQGIVVLIVQIIIGYWKQLSLMKRVGTIVVLYVITVNGYYRARQLLTHQIGTGRVPV